MCAFATVLAGCSNEELVNVQPEVSLDDRASVDFVLSTNAGGYAMGDMDAATRTIWQNGYYYWDSTTKLGACIVDGKAEGTAAYDGIVTNHPFVPVQTLTTPVQEADFQTNTDVREGIYVFYHQFDSKAVTDRKLYCELPVNQVMEDASKPYAHLTEQNFFISPLIKIAGGIADGTTNKLPVKFVSMFSGFAPTFVNNSGKDIEISKVEVTTTGTFYVGGYVNTVTAAGQFDGAVITSDYKTNDELAAAIAEKVEGLKDGTRDLYANIDKKTSKTVSIVLPNIKVANGASQEIRMLFPAGEYTNNTLTVKVYATDGTVCSMPLNSSSSDAITFNRSQFGTKEMKMEDFTKVTGIDIYSIEDWRYAMTLNRPNETITYNLKNNLEIESAEDIPTFAVKVTGAKLILKGENTYEFNDQSEIASLEVDEKATLNYKGGTITSLTNKKGATLNILKDVTVGTGKTIAKLTNNGTMTIAKDVMLDNKAAGFTHTGADAVLENNGTLKLSENWTNGATLNNSGIIAIAESKTLTNSADCTINMNDGYFWYQSGTATTAITNNGTIVLAKAADVFMFGATTPAVNDIQKMTANGTVSLVATTSDNVDYNKISEVTAITLTGEGWNKDNIKKALGTTMKTLTFKDATADLKGCGATDYTDVDFTLEGTTVLNNSATTAEEVSVKSLNVAKNANVTMNGAKQTLKLTEGITVNEGATATNNSHIAMVDAKAITLDGTLNNAGTIDVPGATDTQVSLTVTINAKGTFNNSGNFATENYNTSTINVTGKANFTGGKAYGTVNLLGSNTTTGDVIATIAPTKATSGVGINTLATAGCKEIIVEESVTPSNPLNCPKATIYVLASGNLTLKDGENTVGNMVIGDATAVLAGTTSGSTLQVNGTFTVELAKWTIGTQITTINAANINATCNFKANQLTTIKNLDGSKTWAYDSVTNRWKLN